MLKQTVVWTALPDGIDGPLQEGSTLRLSVLVSPRLWEKPATGARLKLGPFSDFIDWPERVRQIGFRVKFGDGLELDAEADKTHLRSDLWEALFAADTEVIPYTFDDHRAASIVSFSATEAHKVIKRVYQRAATDPAYGAGKVLPPVEVWAKDPDLKDIARPSKPEPPYQAPDRVRVPEKPKEPGCCGCAPLAWLLSWLKKLLKLLGLPLLLAMAGSGASSAAGGSGASSGSSHVRSGNPHASGTKQVFNEVAAFLDSSATKVPSSMPEVDDLKEQFDFHQKVALLADYPVLMRHLGLVVDIKVEIPQGSALPPLSSTVQVIPVGTQQGERFYDHPPKTHYTLDDSRFIARPRPTVEMSNGLLCLNNDQAFRVILEEVAGSAIKLQNMATNTVAMEEPAAGTGSGTTPLSAPGPKGPVVTKAPNMPNCVGLPALHTAGVSVVKPGLVADMRQAFERSAVLNAALAVQDGSPAPDPPPPSLPDELYAEDLVHGYRVDVWDDKSQKWHSLCQRVGTYAFPDAQGGPIAPLTVEDEGFVQPSATGPIDPPTDPNEPPELRVHESLFTWDGWSLCVPRPGEPIEPGEPVASQPGAPASPSQTDLKLGLDVSFTAKPGSLPRLRYGYTYQLRVRVADLAGNSVFKPGDPAFDQGVAEASPEFRFTRFEPVGTPAVAQRAKPKDGESLERLVVCSGDSQPAVATTERHVVPPKVSQLMVEQHGLFDGDPAMKKDQAAWELAAREAGSLTHKFNPSTGQIELIDGVKLQEVVDPNDPTETEKVTQTFWQEKEDFELAYLPDPYARGVLFQNLPGMVPPDAVVQGVNRIAFDGDWPDPKPFRIQLVGIPAGQQPQAPQWEATERVLKVELPEAEIAKVQLNAYLDADDLENMGIWQWVKESFPQFVDDLRQDAIDGKNWLLLPSRDLVLVHAVQRPLEIPKITTLNSSKELEATSVKLEGGISVHSKSTGKVDLLAEWTDPLDDLTIVPMTNVTDETDVVHLHQTAHVAELLVDEGENSVSIANLVHDLGDTKYHRVTYTPVASTRFREYFTPANDPAPPSPEEFIRPCSQDDPSDVTEAQEPVDIFNSARPNAPKLSYIVPTFRWEETLVEERTDFRKVRRTRSGNGLRVYLERPWFSSGAGELLGVVFKLGSPPASVAEPLKPYVTQWGMDPIWEAAAPAVPQPSHLPAIVHPFRRHAAPNLGVTLEEREGQADNVVAVVGYPVSFDEDRQLWYADIEMDLGDAYFPFVRLALVRFQPKSVKDAHISRVVRADYAQLVPDRTATLSVSRDNPGRARIEVQISGPTFTASSATLSGVEGREFEAFLERRIAEIGGDLGWERVDVLPEVLQPEADLWRGFFELQEPLISSQLRLVIKEYEIFRTDLEADISSGNVQTERRPVYADVWEIA